MAEVAVAGAITLVDKLSLWLVKSWFHFKRIEIEIEVLRMWLNTIKAYLKDTEGREDTEGLKFRSDVRDLAYEIQDEIEDLMYEATEIYLCEHVLSIKAIFLPNESYQLQNLFLGMNILWALRSI